MSNKGLETSGKESVGGVPTLLKIWTISSPQGGGGGVLPYMGYVGMCCPKG